LTRPRAVSIALAPMLVLVALMAGCGGSEQPPSPSALVVDSARAVREEKPVRFAFDTEMRVDEIVPAAGAGPEVRRFTDSPLSLGVKGAYSREAIRAEGSAQFSGQTLTAEALAGARELYVRYLGTWYGTKELGLDQFRKQAEQQGGRSSDQAFNQAMSSIERNGPKVFSGEVTEGPELAGTSTWQSEGTLNVDGLLQVAREQGEQVTSEDRALLEKVARGIRLTYVVGQDDKLPRQVRLSFDLRPAEFAGAGGGNSEDLKQVERVRAALTVGMSAWGEEVELSPPPRFEPIEKLAERFLGSMLGGGGLPQAQQ
jgi:hypothetical protein